MARKPKNKKETPIYKNKTTLAVYVVLRALIIFVMVRALLRREYQSMALCGLSLFLMILPSIVSRRLKVVLPSTLEIIILLFIFAAEILGEINSFYMRVPHWDTMLHTINGFLCAAIGFYGINDAHIQIAAQIQRLLGAVGVDDNGICNVTDVDHHIVVRWIQHNGIDDSHHCILLHIHAQELVCTEFKELPQHTSSHRKTEGDNGKIQRRQLKGEFFLPVHHVPQVDYSQEPEEKKEGE